METLNNLCSQEDARHVNPADNIGLQFTEDFLNTSENVRVVLEILEEYDFYVRFHAIQLLATLLANSPMKLQDAVLTAPMGMSRLMDMLDDKREVIRNEGLLLVISLTESNPDIQKIVAFENAFERLLDIILQEDGINGGIIVQDCLQLTHNLLRYNVSNQNYFRETSCIQRIPGMLGYTPPEDPNSDPLLFAFQDWPEQKIINTIFLLDLVRILVVPGNLNTTPNQNVMNTSGLLSPCIDLALSSNSPPRVKTAALYAVSDIIRGNANNQVVFAQATVATVLDEAPIKAQHKRMESSASLTSAIDPNNYQRLPPRPAVSAIVSILVASEPVSSFSVRAAAAYCFQCYVYHNKDAQQAFVTDLVAASEILVAKEQPDGPKTAAEILLSALLDYENDTSSADPYRVWFACISFSHVLYSSEEIKALARGITFGDTESGEEPISLVQSLTGNLMLAFRHATDVRVMLGYLKVFCVWFFESPKTVSDFLSEGANLQLLISPISQSSGVDIMVQGLCAFLLGICYEYDREPDAPISRATLQPLLLSRIGVDHFNNRIARLRESPNFKAATPDLQITAADDAKVLPDLYFDYTFTEFLKTHYAAIQRSITLNAVDTPSNTGGSSTETTAENGQAMASLHAQIEVKDREIAQLQERVRTLEMGFNDEKDALVAQINQLESRLEETQSTLKDKELSLANVEKEQEDLLVYIEDVTQKRRDDKARLRKLGETVSDDEEEAADDDDA